MKPTPLNASERDLIVRYRTLTKPQQNLILAEIAFHESLNASEARLLRSRWYSAHASLTRPHPPVPYMTC